jgi:hypothetical protein
MAATKLDPDQVYVYAVGLVCTSACAPAGLSPEQVATAVNMESPTGIASAWTVSDDAEFADGTPHPAPCDQDPDGRRHYLLYC